MTHQGKFGWYPCDLETYRKLKAINLAYNEAIHKLKAWERWERKDPQNRVIRKKLKDSTGQVVGYGIAEPMPEPEVCLVFCEKIVKSVSYDKNGTYHKNGIDRTFVKMIEDSVYDDYRKARYPVPSEADIKPLFMNLDRINQLFSDIKGR